MDENTNQLGEYLKAARERKQLSLRAVEKATGISNAYLSQLENGSTKQPSPMMLHKLALVYELSYSELFELAGYPLPNQSESSATTKLAARFGTVTAEEESQLLEYLDFLRSKRRKRGND